MRRTRTARMARMSATPAPAVDRYTGDGNAVTDLMISEHDVARPPRYAALDRATTAGGRRNDAYAGYERHSDVVAGNSFTAKGLGGSDPKKAANKVNRQGSAKPKGRLRSR